MEYRALKKLDIKTSLLGYGCMRFPTDKNGKIDVEKTDELLETAMKNGVNYFDTAYPYHGGESEPVVGKFLDKYKREDYYIATKLPSWEIKTLDDAKRIFNKQLSRLNKDYIDFYLLHALNINTWQNLVNVGAVEYCKQLKKEGKIKYLGFSFHDEYNVFEKILTSEEWDFCQIQLNYMDTEIQAGLKGYELAKKMGVPMVVMEPVKGGLLANLPEEITDVMKSVSPNRSTASWALRWVGTHENVCVILSGMSTLEQVNDNLQTFGKFEPLTESEQQTIRNLVKTLNSRVNNGCTGCRYCMPCSAGVDIPGSFSLWNNFGIYGDKENAKRHWKNFDESEKPKNCIKCRKCEKLCPQKISICDDLAKMQLEFDGLAEN